MEPNGQLHLLLHIMEIPNMQVNIVVFKIKIILSIQFISHRHYQLSTSRSPNITRRRTTLNCRTGTFSRLTAEGLGSHFQTPEGASSGVREMQQEPSTESCRYYIHTCQTRCSVHLRDNRKTKFCFVFYFDCGSEMAERPTITPAMLSQEKPLVKIGHYVLGETLGVGTFGKVKSIKIKSI